MSLGLGDHRRESQPKSAGNAVSYVQARVPLAPLDEADMSVMDVSLLGEDFLTESFGFSMLPNGRPKGQRDAAAIRHRGSKMASGAP
jgi:hypothetical protein